MPDAGRAATAVFGVQTIHLDLPPLAGALGQRLRDAGVPVTAERSAEFARALTLVRPNSRRRLYWTARSVFVSDRSQAETFDAVFRSVFGAPAETESAEPSDRRSAAPPIVRERPRERRPRGSSARDDGGHRLGAPPARATRLRGRGGGVPMAMASDEEMLAGKRFDALERGRARAALPADVAPGARHAAAAHPPLRAGRHGERIDMRRTLRASLRTGGDPIRLARGAGASSPGGS